MKDTDLFDAIAHIDEDLIDRCLAEDDANRGIGQELSSEPAVTVTEIKPGSVGKRIAVAVASIAAALVLTFGLVSILHIGGKKPVEPVNDPTDPPVTTEAVPTEAVPGPAADADILREFFERKDAAGVKNGDKLFPNYDPADPATWIDEGDEHDKKLEFNSDGQLTSAYLSCADYASMMLAGDLDLDRFEALDSFFAVNLGIDGKVNAENVPKAATNEFLALHVGRSEGIAVYRGCYLEDLLLRSALRTSVEMSNPLGTDPNYLSPALRIEVVTAGSGYAGVNGWSNEDFYEVHLSAEPKAGAQFLGWYEDGRLVSTEPDYALISEAPESSLAGETSEYRFIAKFSSSISSEEAEILREFFEQEDERLGEKNGLKLFGENYDPDDPSTWVWTGNKQCVFKFDESGRLTFVNAEGYELSTPVLVGDLELDKFDSLTSFSITDYIIDGSIYANGMKTAYTLELRELIANMVNGPAVFSGGYCERIRLLSKTSTVVNMTNVFEEQTWLHPAFKVTVNTEGAGYAGVNAWDDENAYEVRLEARPDTGKRFLGWYDENGRLVSTEESICLKGKDRSEPLRSSYKYTAKFAQPAAPTPLPEGDFFCEIIPNVPSHIDIDGDGREDTVLFNMFTDEYNEQDMDVLITLASDPDNTYTFKTYGEARGNVCGGAVDFDPSDGHIEIVVNYDECDGDPMTYVYRIRDDGSGFDTFVDYVFIEWLTEDRIRSWGFHGIPEGWAFDAKEGLSFSKRTEILGTCFVFNHFTVTENGIEYLDDEFLYPSFEHIVGSQYTLLRELTVTLENGKTKTLKKGDKISPYSTDRQTFVCVKLEDGRIGRVEVTFGDPEDLFPVLLNGVRQDEYMEIHYAD